MNANEFSFPVSLSMENFWNKEESGCMIGTGKDEQNRELRKLYGWDPSRGVSFTRVEVTPLELYNHLLNGKVLCNLFNPQHTRQDGSFGMSEKKDENFAGSNIIGVDIDKTGFSSVTEYVNTLTLEPTFYYTSYSNQQLGKGLRFRLIYVLKDQITNTLDFRYYSRLLNSKIEEDTGERIEDDCNTRASQYFNGTNIKNSSLITTSGYSGKVYSLTDLGGNKDGLKQFLRNNGEYKTLTRDKKEKIKNRLNQLEPDQQQQHTPELEETEHRISKELIHDMKRLSYDEFMKYNRHKFKYTYRSEEGEWINGIYQKTKEGDFSLYWNTTKVKDGQKRRKKLFQRICLRRILNPSIDPDTLLFNAYEDRQRFFEVDKDLDIDCLVRNVETALDMEIPEIEIMFSDNLEYLRSRKKPNSIIFKSGEYTSKNDLKNVTWNIITEHYKPELSMKENYKIISKLVNVTERTLRNFCKENGFTVNQAKLSDQQVIDLLDLTLSANENYKRIREEGYQLDRSRLLRIYREMKREL